MSPLQFLRQGLIYFFLLSYFTTTAILAQRPDELEKMGKDAKGFIFKLKFNGSGDVSPGDAKYAKITSLLDNYKSQVPANIQLPFKVKGPEASQKPFLIDEQSFELRNQATMFFREMAEQKLLVQDLLLTVSIRITSRGQVITKTLTTASPKQYVQFGWDGEIIIK